jgi:hypothetical protein
VSDPDRDMALRIADRLAAQAERAADRDARRIGATFDTVEAGLIVDALRLMYGLGAEAGVRCS